MSISPDGDRISLTEIASDSRRSHLAHGDRISLGGDRISLTAGERHVSASKQQLASHLRREPQLFSSLLSVLLDMIIFEECANQVMSRKLSE